MFVLEKPRTSGKPRTSPVAITPLSGSSIGASVRGVRIGGRMSSADFNRIHDALLRYKVVFIIGQSHLDDGSQQAFARRFGDIVAHPTVGKSDKSAILELHSHRGGRANSWHTDVTFQEKIPKISILRPIALPEFGGDTVWADTAAAYRHLPESLRTLAERLWAVHGNDFDYAASRVELLHDKSSVEYRKKYAAKVIKSEHPVVHVHPETGEKCLLLGHYAQRFVDYNTHDSDRIYDILQAHVTRLENTVRWRWSPGDVAIWDNRATQHYAINDYGDNLRVMHRVTVSGDKACSVDGQTSRPHRQ